MVPQETWSTLTPGRGRQDDLALDEAHHMQRQLHQGHVRDVGQDVLEDARAGGGADGLGERTYSRSGV